MLNERGRQYTHEAGEHDQLRGVNVNPFAQRSIERFAVAVIRVIDYFPSDTRVAGVLQSRCALPIADDRA